MSMVFLANVPSITSDNCISFYTPYEHVAVDYPNELQADYLVSSYYNSDFVRTNDFASAMDLAADFLKLAELRAHKFNI